MKPIHLSVAAALAAMLILGVAATPSQAGSMGGGTNVCWQWYNWAWEQMQAGNHKGYNQGMKQYNHCMNANWEGPKPKKKRHN
jgi:hypothetical protein